MLRAPEELKTTGHCWTQVRYRSIYLASPTRYGCKSIPCSTVYWDWVPLSLREKRKANIGVAALVRPGKRPQVHRSLRPSRSDNGSRSRWHFRKTDSNYCTWRLCSRRSHRSYRSLPKRYIENSVMLVQKFIRKLLQFSLGRKHANESADLLWHATYLLGCKNLKKNSTWGQHCGGFRPYETVSQSRQLGFSRSSPKSVGQLIVEQ